MTSIIIPGKPIAKKRPRFARRGKFTVTYSDQETEAGKFLLLAKQQIDKIHTGPLRVDMLFFLARPKSHYGTGKNSTVLKSSAPAYPDSKPDYDNYIKFALDCLNEIAWDDDSQVIGGSCFKLYAKDGNARTEITISEMTL